MVFLGLQCDSSANTGPNGVAKKGEIPADHPAIEKPDKRLEASRLTEAVAGRHESESVAKVPRKNYIDDYIFGKMERDNIPHAPLATDVEFFRRAYFDLTGRLPSPEALEEFLKSNDPDKRDKLIDQLVDSDEFVAKWTYWICDIARNARNRIGLKGANLFYDYVYDNLQYNRPWNEFISEILTAKALSNWYVGPATCLVRWVVLGDNPVDTMHEDTADEMTVNAFKHFMGLNLQCISCHDGEGHLEKINLWLVNKTREDFWKQAAFFGLTRVLRRINVSEHRDEYSIDDRGTGYDASAPSVVRIPRTGEGKVEPVFILTGEKPDPNKPLREELAQMFTGHIQFARATVNQIWTHLMGVGIVEPVDDFDLARLDPNKPLPEGWELQATHPELLEKLAQDFVAHDYDIRYISKLIAKSSAYQLSSKFPGEWKASYAKYFARKFVRRLMAEEIYDALVDATKVYTKIPIRGTDITVKHVMETRTPEDISGGRFPGKRDLQFFLESFGQPNREFSERTNEGTIIQAILMMNSPVVKQRVRRVPGSYLDEVLKQGDALSDEEFVRKLFLRFLLRPPEKAEQQLALNMIQKLGREKAGEEIQWALVNKLDFLFNY